METTGFVLGIDGASCGSRHRRRATSRGTGLRGSSCVSGTRIPGKVSVRKRLKEGSRYFEADPSTVQIAIELKTVMTERRARRGRHRASR